MSVVSNITKRKRSRMSPGVCCKEGHRKQGVSLGQSRGLNSSYQKCYRYCTQHSGIMVSEASDILNFPISPLLGGHYVHFFDQIYMQFSPKIPCLLLLSIRHSVSLLKRKLWPATMKSWLLATVSSDLYSCFPKCSLVPFFLLLGIFTSYLDSLKPLMNFFCFVLFLSFLLF